jgi:dihydrofolate synthase/folylpolyglutamate synthase
MMNYHETLEYLYNVTPLFQNVGKDAYKEGLDNTLALDARSGHPHRLFRTIHVAGTNGKGSCSHTLAAILQAAGYRVGLYTSPHLKDFRERIRVNGAPIPEEYVVKFVDEERPFFEPLHPSFFELTTAMAFRYFAESKVDVAVVEVGLGGRLDCTNIIHPALSLITNISFDHVQFLGDTLAKIAAEKAGIIKKDTPVVIGEACDETRPVFEAKAKAEGAPIIFAEEHPYLVSSEACAEGGRLYTLNSYPLFKAPLSGEGLTLKGELGGLCQDKNTQTLLTALTQLREAGFEFTEQDIRRGFAEVCRLTGLMGRWQKLQEHPTLICDTGHNVGGMQYIAEQLRRQPCKQLRIVIGMVNDKDLHTVLGMLPREAKYYFTQASVKRARPAGELKALAAEFGLEGEAWSNVAEALEAAKRDADEKDLIFVGGSSFIVADLLNIHI